MLVLSRRRNEEIIIDDEIVIAIIDIRGDKVRVGIRAPGRMSVHRKEVYDRIKAQQRGDQEVKLGPLRPSTRRVRGYQRRAGLVAKAQA